MSADNIPNECQGCYFRDGGYFFCARWRLQHAMWEMQTAIRNEIPLIKRFDIVPAPAISNCEMYQSDTRN